MNGGRFTEEDHPSDAFLRLSASTAAELYRTAARACFSVMADLASVRARDEREVACEGADREELLVVWLNELIGLASAERVLFCEFDVAMESQTRLRARVRGEPVDPARHTLYREVKAATYHQLSVRRAGGGWEATVLLDL